LYHVISRGNQQQNIFLDERDLRKFLSYLSEYKQKYRFRLYAYALMKNHFHLLTEVEKPPLSRIMQSLLFRYTRYFNWRYGKVGHLFQGRYRAILCDKDTYLLELVRYIHLNPVRAAVVPRPEDYRWTGHLEFVGKVKSDLVDKNFVLDQFGKNGSEARRRYREFVLDGLKDGHRKEFYEVKDQRYLGEDSFIDRIETEKNQLESWVYDVSLEAISQEVIKTTGIRGDKLHSMTRDRQGAYGRGLVGYMAKRISDYRVKEIADYFRRSSVAIGEAIMKVEKLLGEDNSLEKVVELTERNLIRGKKRKYRVTVA
jgi:REP element-mobilizing transposase RayT